MMKKFFILSLILISHLLSYSQYSLKNVIKDAKTMQPLVGAVAYVQDTGIKLLADSLGFIHLNNIPAGKQIIIYDYLGYYSKIDTLTFPLPQPEPNVILLIRQDDEELEEVIISSTRSSRTIDKIPSRVEVIAGEELDEKGNMKPGDIRMLLNESTGIQTQQTSAISANSSIRIQGLDGKYTQIIRDGFPLYSGFSGGLGLLQITPLDLKRVEVIKGSSSTLYGGGAIAGLVNLISKTPENERRLDFLLNGTSALGLDVSTFYSKRNERIRNHGLCCLQCWDCLRSGRYRFNSNSRI